MLCAVDSNFKVCTPCHIAIKDLRFDKKGDLEFIRWLVSANTIFFLFYFCNLLFLILQLFILIMQIFIICYCNFFIFLFLQLFICLFLQLIILCFCRFLGRFIDRVDLIKPVSNVHPSVSAYVRTSTKSFFDFSETWHVSRCR